MARRSPGWARAWCSPPSIVGSGELIATTTLGAQAGYVALWVILLSCAVKPAVQAELGRYTIATGETGLEALDRMPGPRLGVSWILWAWAATVFLSLLQVGGMYGGLAQLMNLLVPAVPATAWALAFLALTLALVLGGGYERVERLALVKVALFTLLTVLAAIVLTRQGEHFSWARVAEGLRFRLPEAGFATAVAVYGITGVGATELFMYPYWCVEKGYARFVGPIDGSASRLRRARGWIRLMHADVAASMVLYTLATAGVLPAGGRGAEPARPRALGPRHDPHPLAPLHRHPRGLGAAALLPRRHRHPLRHDLRRDRRALPPLRRLLPRDGPLRARRLRRGASCSAAASRCC